MTIWNIYPAIAFATVITGFVIAVSWKATRIEEQTGEPPGWYVFGMLAYLGSIGAYIYFNKGSSVTHYGDMFVVALAAELMGLVFFWSTYKLLFPKPGSPRSDRVFNLLGAALFALIVIGPFFIGSGSLTGP